MATFIMQMRPDLLAKANDRLKTETRRLNVARWIKVKAGDTVKVKTSRTGKVEAVFVATADAREDELQNVSIRDCFAEGCVCPSCGYTLRDMDEYADGNGHHLCKGLQGTTIDAFRELWESINGPRSWDRNDKVAVVTFAPGGEA